MLLSGSGVSTFARESGNFKNFLNLGVSLRIFGSVGSKILVFDSPGSKYGGEGVFGPKLAVFFKGMSKPSVLVVVIWLKFGGN